MEHSIEGKIFLNGSFEDACIGIKDGKISEIKKNLKYEDHTVFKNKIILPAGIDLHVHFREPGLTAKEDFKTGSLAALFGGISCVFDMPNTIPQTTSLDTISEKISIAEKKSFVDFGIYCGISNDNIKDIERLSKKSNGFKAFLGNSTLSLLLDKNKLREVIDLVGLTGKPILFHAEDEECLIANKKTETGISDHMRYRPSVCEEISIKNILQASANIHTKVHICHVSSCEGLELLKNRPGNVSFGITPHHSLLNVERNVGSETLYKVNPPIRTSFDRESLFNALLNGVATALESDHAPHTHEEKDTDFDLAPSGLPGVETIYPLFLYLVKKEMFSFQRLISLICARPANLLGVSKGKIEQGFDADFIVVDLDNITKIKSENLHSKCGWSPFEDWPAIFPESVFIRGEKLIDENEIQVKQGFGEFVGA